MNRLENTRIMKNQTFGVEIEMSRISREKVAMTVCKYFREKYSTTTPYYTFVGGSYDKWIATDNKGREWKMVSDASVQGGVNSCELVTPILKYEDIEDLQEIVRVLRGLGAKSNADYGCGVHIHVGVQDMDGGSHNPHTLRNLLNIVNSHQNILAKAIGFTMSRTDYCDFISSELVRKMNAEKPRTMTDLQFLHYRTLVSYVNTWQDVLDESREHYSGSRYYFLNLHAVWYRGTVEFRCFEFHKNMHAGELKAYIQLCLAMSNYAKMVAYANPREIAVTNEKFSMKNWLVNMGMTGDEFKTARKMLMKRLTGDPAYLNAREHVVAPNTLDDLGLE